MIEYQDNGHDNGGTRTGYERRQHASTVADQGRRLGRDRRNGIDRRRWIGRKRRFERRDIFTGVDD